MDHLPPALFRHDETGSDKDRELAGEGALAQSRCLDHLPCRKPTGLGSDQHSVGVESGGMRECRQGGQCFTGLHPSRNIDALMLRQILSENLDETMFARSEEHTSELQSLMRISNDV